MKRSLALLLVLVMTLSLFAGCGKTETHEAPTTEVEQTPEVEAPQEEVPAWKQEHPTWLCEEKQTLTVYTDEALPPFLNSSNDLYFWQWMEDYTNVHIEWELGAQADYATLVSAKLASGEELADIMYVNDTTTGINAGTNGLLVDLAPYLDTCFPNTKTYFDAQGRDYLGDITNPDGTFYGLRAIGDEKENMVVPMFNTKWMEQLGLEIPTTLEEFENVLRAMKEAGDLNGNGVDDEVVWSGAGVLDMFVALAHAFGIEYMNNEHALYSADENGQVYDWWTTDNMKAMLTWLNQMYEEGLLDPEITVMKSANMNEKVTADRVGVCLYYSTFATTYGNMTSGGLAEPYSEQFTIGVPLASEWNNNEPKLVKQIRYGNRFTGISKDCDNVELAAKWLDVLVADPNALDVRCYGKEGETFYYDENGVAQIILPSDGSAWSLNPYGCGQIELVHFQIREQTNFSRANMAPWWDEQYEVIRDEKYWMKPSIPKVGSKTDEEQMIYDMYWAELRAGWEEYRDKFITGELDTEADWDTFVATMEGLGLHELGEGCFQSIYDRTR